MSIVERIGDMDLKSKLVLWRQKDGDVVVIVIQEDGRRAEVEFCSPAGGGGRSRDVWEKLIDLHELMKKQD